MAQCGTSEVGGGQAGSNFKIASGTWTASFDGEIMGVGGHIHDGGVNLEVISNGQVACNSQAWYGTNEDSKKRAQIVLAGGYPSPDLPPSMPLMPAMTSAGAAPGGHGHDGGQHIVAMGVCGEVGGYNGSPPSPLKISKVVKGTPWKIQAYYDYKQFNGMRNNRGGMDTVMGIAIMFVRASTKMRTGAASGPAAGAVPKALFASEFDDAGLRGAIQ